MLNTPAVEPEPVPAPEPVPGPALMSVLAAVLMPESFQHNFYIIPTYTIFIIIIYRRKFFIYKSWKTGSCTLCYNFIRRFR